MSFIGNLTKGKQGIRRYIGPKRVLLLVVFLGFFAWAWHAYHGGAINPHLIVEYREEHPALAVLLFILIYLLSVVAALPSLPLNLAAGFIWGGLFGGLYTAMGVTIGSWLSFLAARMIVGQPLERKFENRWAATVQKEFDRSGWKFVAFARINPIIPTGPLNFLLGLTSLSSRSFLWSTFLFILPPSIAVAYIGNFLQTFAADQTDVRSIISRILIVSAAVTFLVLLKFASNIYRKRGENSDDNTSGDDT